MLTYLCMLVCFLTAHQHTRAISVPYQVDEIELFQFTNTLDRDCSVNKIYSIKPKYKISQNIKTTIKQEL